jgi:DNA-binding response OmpR family regulator
VERDPAVARPRTIVVIDDEAEVRRLVEAILKQAGYRVVVTGEPAGAVDLVRETEPDLVLCDIAMPGMTGYDVLKALQRDPETAHFPVVFLTAHREFSERVRAFRFGAVDFVSKPFTREILLRRIERVVAGLERREGTVAEAGPAGEALLADVRRESRSGVLTVRQPEGERRIVVSAGEVVEGDTTAGMERAAHVEFQELDHRREEIVPHDPPQLRGEPAGVPSFRDLPEVFRTVLVVDDNDVFRGFLAGLLRRQGLEVLEAREGEEALRLAFIQRPWLIVTDTKMPRLDGFELCRRVRRHALIGQTPVVFLSGWDDYKSRYKAYELGASEYISKLSPVRELLMRIHLLLRRYAELGERGGSGGMHGGIEVIGAAGILQTCHMSGLSGALTVRSGLRHVEVRFSSGEIVDVQSERSHGIEALNELLGWTRGAFEFKTLPADPAAQPLGSFAHMLLEGCRILDEQRGVPQDGAAQVSESGSAD